MTGRAHLNIARMSIALLAAGCLSSPQLQGGEIAVVNHSETDLVVRSNLGEGQFFPVARGESVAVAWVIDPDVRPSALSFMPVSCDRFLKTLAVDLPDGGTIVVSADLATNVTPGRKIPDGIRADAGLRSDQTCPGSVQRMSAAT